jgi:hypothetical protein
VTRWSAIVVVACALVAAPSFARADESGVFAQQRYDRGLELYDQKKWEPALAEFRASYELLASPNSRLFIARCLRALGRLDEAAIELQETWREAATRAETDKRYAPTRDAAKTELDALKPKIAFVIVTVNDLPKGAKVVVGKRALPAATVGLPVPVMPGTIVIAVDAEGHARNEKSITIVAGDTTNVSLSVGPALAPEPAPGAAPTPTPAPASASGLRTSGWIAIGVGVVGGIGFATFGLLARSKYQTLDDECGGGPCATDRSDEISAGKRWQTLGIVSAAIGVVGLATGTVILISTSDRGDRGESSPKVGLGIGPGTFSLQGSF